MDLKNIMKQTVDFQKATFDNTFNAMTMLQEQAEKMSSMFLDQTTGLPEEGKKVIGEWIDTYKKGREDFKKSVDESFKKVEDFFAGVEKSKKK
ncbi:MAG: hypothetical protein JRD69_05940 [Deltaproteobacteria bacterium]|nr:hypothetical protein [Deltaproteobacteria bacterium]